VQLRNTKRLRAEYQLSRQVFIRVIGEHAVLDQDSRRTTARLDVLFPYLPNPGTVLFLGYGDQVRADRPQGPDRLQRTRDVLFMKLSYLFRLR